MIYHNFSHLKMFQVRIFSSHFRHNFTSTKTTLLRKMIALRTLTRTTTTAVEQGSQFPFVIPKERVAENETGSISPSSMLTLEQEQLLELKANKQQSTENNKMEAVAKEVGQQYLPGLLKNFFTKISINRNFHPQHKMILRESATKLYDSCANGSNYILLHKEFGMPDNFFSWYRLTLLHIWMGLVRMQQSLEFNSFCLFRSQVTNLFHKDAMERYKAFYEDDHYAKQQRNKRFKLFYRGVFIHTFFELDEGFLLDDRNFAGAVWRSIFVFDENVEIVHLNRAVRYIRSVLHHLDTLDTDKILMEGIEIWNLEMSQNDEQIFQRQQNKQQIES